MKHFIEKIKTHLVVPSLGFALLFWVFDVYVDVLVFKEGTIKEHFISPEPFEIYYRTFVVLMFIAFGFIAQKLVKSRKKAEETLKIAEGKYKIVAENTYDWEFWTGPDRKFIFTSPSSIRVTGYSPEKFDQDPDFLDSIIYPDDMPAYDLHRKEAEMEHGLHEVEFRINHADGSVRWISHACQPVTGLKGEYLGIRGTNRDITARKRVEIELEINEKKYRGLFSSMLNGFALHKIIVDEKGIPADYEYLEVNQAFERMTGLKREDIIGRRATEVMPDIKKDSFNWIGTYGKVALDNQKMHFEQYSQPLGKWYNITAYSPSKGEFATVLEDISERKKIENVVRENQERLDTIFNSIQTGIMVIDRETHTIAYVNEAATKMIGSPREQLLDQICQKHVCPADIGFCPITDKGQKVDNSERVLLTADGRQLPILKTVVEIELDGRQVLVESFVDISERKLAEVALNAEAIRRRILIEQSRDGIVVLTTDGSVYESNHRFAEMIGYSPEEINQIHVWDWEFQYTREQTIDMIRNVGEAGDFFETRHRRKDGTLYDVEISTNGAIFEGEKLIFCVCRDITERKKQEKAIKEQALFFKTLIDTILNPVFYKDTEGKYLGCNKAFEEL
ncbi:MAG: PAS domain-containing protein, partial [Desulfocucumaceae bacterium]